jgi:diguanylate cyclase (GGDEF)-like protein
VFCGVIDERQIAALIRELGDAFPGAPILGTTTAGEIIDGQSVENTILINVTRFQSTWVRTALVTHNDDLRIAGRQLGTSLRTPNTKAALVFGCSVRNGQTLNAEPLLAGLQEELPGVIIGGGQAGDNGTCQRTLVFTEDGITERGAAGASLSGAHLQANNTYNLSWIPIGKKLTITRAEGSRIYTIDNQPPLEIYRHYLGQEVVDGLPLSAADFPIMLERDGVLQAIHPIGVNKDGSFNYIPSFHAGEQLRFGFCHVGLLAQGASVNYQHLAAREVQVAFIYSCISRKWVLGADIAVELTPVSNLGPCAGFFCYGEYYFHETGKALFFGQTMTVLTLAETDQPAAHPAERRVPVLNQPGEESKQFRSLRVLHRLMETSAHEIESMNRELACLAHKDSLTGLANRRQFDKRLRREIEHLSDSLKPLSLIMLDVDHFKEFNDTYGHVSGDDCLRGIAQVFGADPQQRNNLAARYGGEEFACILPDLGHAGALALAERFRQEIMGLAIPHKTSSAANVVTASIGVVTVECTPELMPHDVLALCDHQLYRAKESGRNIIAELDLRRSPQDAHPANKTSAKPLSYP